MMIPVAAQLNNLTFYLISESSFMAIFSSFPPIFEVLKNSILVFNEHATEHNDHYDVNTGLFTCPVTGELLYPGIYIPYIP